MDEIIKTFLSITAIFISLAGILFTYFGLILKIKEDIEKDKEQILAIITDIRIHLGNLEIKGELVWRCIESKAVEMLKSYPTFLDKDLLLEKFNERSLTVSDAEQLRMILGNEMKLVEIANTDKFCYLLILGRLEQVIYELRQEAVHGKPISDHTE